MTLLPKRGDIYVADLGQGVGSEQANERPVVIVQNNKGNAYADTTIIVPITSRMKNDIPNHVIIHYGILKKYIGCVLTEQVRTISIYRLKKYLGTLNEKDIRKIDKALKISLELNKRKEGGNMKIKEVSLDTAVKNFFKDDEKNGLQKRKGQIEMSREISQAIVDNKSLAVEAEVGIGKSIAYLVPIILQFFRERRQMIIATSTITLQDQLERDIERILDTFGVRADVEVAKGMKNFVCLKRFQRFIRDNDGYIKMYDRAKNGEQDRSDKEIKNITIPESVIKINKPFTGCSALEEITFKRADTKLFENYLDPIGVDEDETLYVGLLGEDAEADNYRCKVYVPDAAYCQYANVFYTEQFVDVIPESMREHNILTGDVNGDNDVSIADAVKLQNYLVGKEKDILWFNSDLIASNQATEYKEVNINAFDFIELKKMIINNSSV